MLGCQECPEEALQHKYKAHFSRYGARDVHPKSHDISFLWHWRCIVPETHIAQTSASICAYSVNHRGHNEHNTSELKSDCTQIIILPFVLIHG